MRAIAKWSLLVTLSTLKGFARGSAVVRSTSQPSRLDLLGCAILSPTEYDKQVVEGKCPPISQKKPEHFELPESVRKHLEAKRKKRTKKKTRLSSSAKKGLLRAVLLGNLAIYTLNLRSRTFDVELLEGLFLILRCPGSSKKLKKKVEWFLDGDVIGKAQLLNWRIRVNEANQLEIWPLLVGHDDGRYECYIDGESKGSASVRVISMKNGVLKGVFNFFITALFASPFVAFALAQRAIHPARTKVVIEDDPIIDYYERIMKLKTTEMKEHIGRSVYQDKFRQRRNEIEKTVAQSMEEGGASTIKLRSNRDCVITMVKVGELGTRTQMRPVQRRVAR